MRLELLSNHIHQAGLGIPGQTLFISMMPDSCKQGIVLRAPLYGIDIDHELPRYYRATVQAIIRAQANEPGEDLAKRVLTLLTIYNQEIHFEGYGMRINQMLPKTKPIVYPRSDANGIEWSINFGCSYVEL